VLIDITAKASTDSIVFHLDKNVNVTHLALHTSELKSTSSSALPLESLTFDEDRERATIDLKQAGGQGLRAGADAKLWVRFEAELTGSMAGYYKSEGDAGEDGKKPVYVGSDQEGI
jgi:aminopeptidase 2